MVDSSLGIIYKDIRASSRATVSVLLIKQPHHNGMPHICTELIIVSPLTGPHVFNLGLDFRLIRSLLDTEEVSVAEEIIPRFDSRQSS